MINHEAVLSLPVFLAVDLLVPNFPDIIYFDDPNLCTFPEIEVLFMI